MVRWLPARTTAIQETTKTPETEMRNQIIRTDLQHLGPNLAHMTGGIGI